jgi:predicted metalloprotease with PDZ domain
VSARFSSIRRLVSLSCAAAFGAGSLAAQSATSREAAGRTTTPSAAALQIAYVLEARDPATHEATVRVRVSGALGDTTLLQLPAWYPGRYAIYNFAANVQETHAACDGRAIPTPKRDKQTWIVRCKAAPRGSTTLEFSQLVWWDDLTGSTSQIDSLHVNVNPGTIFPYVVGHKADSVSVTYVGPEGWTVINGAIVTPWPGAVTQRFPNYDVFIDHPTEIASRISLDTFSLEGTQYRVLVHAEGDTGVGLRRRLAADLEAIVRTEVAFWGVQPMERYTFLVHFIPGNRGGGDGMEHLTSCQVIIPSALADTAGESGPQGAYGRHELFAHEFFHAWNMKRLRARELGPWDYTRDNPTPTLWVGEGFTNYYGARLVYRAGLWSPALYLARVAANISQLQATPGRLAMSVEDASLSAWFMDRVPLRQQATLHNSAVSYYTKGEALAWLLDLEVRARTGGEKTLDDVMRLLWHRFWNGATTTYYLQGHGYADADVRQALNDVTQSEFSDFFARYVAGTEELPYGWTLGKVGLRLVTDAGSTAARIEADPDASEDTRRIGEAWLEGR